MALKRLNLESGKEFEAFQEEGVLSKRKENIILNSKNRMRQLLDIVPYPLLVTDPNSITLYVNTGFTETFGWTLDELMGKKIIIAPPGMKKRTREKIQQLFRDGILELQETQRMTKDGRILDVAIRSAYHAGRGDEPDHIVTILRDVTKDKRIARINDAMHRISMALPKYTALSDLMNYISMEVKDLVGCERATILLLDSETNALFSLGSAYEEGEGSNRRREIGLSMDVLVATQVMETGEPVAVSLPVPEYDPHENRGKNPGYGTKNLAEVPLRAGNLIFGVLCAVNKKNGRFEKADMGLLNTIAATVALSVENARVTDKVKEAYGEVTSLSRAKDKAIDHLSHELRTPVAILKGSLKRMKDNLEQLQGPPWKATLERIFRNLDRIRDIECEVHDIMHQRESRSHNMLSTILDQCGDELETLITEEVGEVPVIGRIKEKIEEIFGLKEDVFEIITLPEFIRDRLTALRSRFAHRDMDIRTHLKTGTPIRIPREVLRKVFDGLLKNAIENTPDEGCIEVVAENRSRGVAMIIKDHGVGIRDENRRRIFEGFFHTQETVAYSSKRPFDFNAGGRGADLLRLKIFSERYGFNIDMNSSRCPCLNRRSDICPGRISVCVFCKERRNCHNTGGATFRVFFRGAHF